MDLTNSTVFIPGATSGIGLALAVALHEQGSTVVVGGRRSELLEQIAAEHPRIDTVRIDTTDPESIQSAAKEVLERHPDLDTLVAMAGIMRAEDWHHPEGFLATAEETFTTNVLGPVRLVGAFVEHLQSRPHATIVTVSSGLAFAPLAATPSYDASKAAIHMLSEALRLQLADTSVRVAELVPPSVATDLMPGQRESAFAMPLDEFVSEVVELLRTQPDAHEILVERVKFLRHGESRSDYDDVVRVLNASDPHGELTPVLITGEVCRLPRRTSRRSPSRPPDHPGHRSRGEEREMDVGERAVIWVPEDRLDDVRSVEAPP